MINKNLKEVKCKELGISSTDIAVCCDSNELRVLKVNLDHINRGLKIILKDLKVSYEDTGVGADYKHFRGIEVKTNLYTFLSQLIQLRLKEIEEFERGVISEIMNKELSFIKKSKEILSNEKFDEIIQSL